MLLIGDRLQFDFRHFRILFVASGHRGAKESAEFKNSQKVNGALKITSPDQESVLPRSFFQEGENCEAVRDSAQGSPGQVHTLTRVLPLSLSLPLSPSLCARSLSCSRHHR